MSPEIRLKTAQTLQRLPEIIQLGKTLQEAALASELKGQLLQRLEKERELDEIYGALSDSLAAMAEHFAMSEDYGAAIEIIDTFWRHRSPSEMRKPEQQKLAMDAIESIATPELLEGLADVLREGDIETITEVANILIKFENKSVQPLIQVLKESDDILVRKVTFDALEYIGKDAIKTLINDLERYDPWHMYRNIISILAEIGNRSIIQSLSRFINHQNPEVRRETVKAIGRIQTAETISLLLEGLTDRDEMVQRECCLALGRIGDISTSPALAGDHQARAHPALQAGVQPHGEGGGGVGPGADRGLLLRPGDRAAPEEEALDAGEARPALRGKAGSGARPGLHRGAGEP